MNFVEPICDRKKIAQIKNQLRGEHRFRDLLLFIMGINTALRISDLLRLRVEHFLDEKKRVRQRFLISFWGQVRSKKLTSLILLAGKKSISPINHTSWALDHTLGPETTAVNGKFIAEAEFFVFCK